MKNIQKLPLLFGAILGTIILLGSTTVAQAQANANPPTRLSYQGFLTDGNGVPYGNAAPVNKTVIFRIYDAETAGTIKWGETQIVTIDKGHFSVLLGEGSLENGITNDLMAVFSGSTASERYLQLIVDSVPIAPRVRFLTSPYAFLSRTAIGLSDNGASLTALNAANLTNGIVPSARLSGTYSSALTFNNSANNFSGNGSGLTGFIASQIPNLDAAKINAGAFSTDRIPALDASKINAGAFSTDRIPALDASKINSGAFSSARIPNLDASKINSGAFASDRIPTSLTGTRSFMGYLGVGTLNPTRGYLHVVGSLGNPGISIHPWAHYNPLGQVTANDYNAQAVTPSIFAEGSIFCTSLYLGHVGTASDERIKTVQGISNGADDLNKLLEIQITEYKYKDSIKNGTNLHKKVIAQQVEKVFPEAILPKVKECVPDIFQNAEVNGNWVKLATNLKIGDRVRLLTPDREVIEEVLEVHADGFRTAFQPEAKTLFVYGREVSDFRSVDYDAIAMLNVSATQELARRLAKVQSESKLVADLTKKAERVDELEHRVAELESLILRLAQQVEKGKETLNATRNLVSK